MIIKDKYHTLYQIGQGKFGTLYKGIIDNKEKTPIVIKYDCSNIGMIKHETTILNYLQQRKCKYIPWVYWYGITQEPTTKEIVHGLIMPYFDCSLLNYINNVDMTNDLLDEAMIHILNIIEQVHDNFVVHRDIKPDNFMVRNTGDIYLIDFGLSTFYVDENKNHKECKRIDDIIGSPTYISINIHDGYTPSRRDDMISIGYLYLYMMMNSLPWENNIQIERRAMKDIAYIRQICDMINNEKIYKYLYDCYQIEYSNRPNYLHYRSLFSK